MEDILKSVTDAEAEAAAIRADAEARANEIILGAEEQAAEIARKCEAEMKLLREERLRAAQLGAQKDYERALADESARQKKYADGLIGKCDGEARKIVGRITGGNR